VISRRDIIALLATLLIATPALAQQGAVAGGGFLGLLEMPGQRALQEVRARPDTVLSPFVTDGCSGGLSEGWKLAASLLPGFAEAEGTVPPWEGCCVIHDHAYHGASDNPAPEANFTARLVADRALRQCVQASIEPEIDVEAARYGLSPERLRDIYGLIAGAMYSAVRLGGMPCTALPWRWGYGYPDCSLQALGLGLGLE
jgi:hypothetical protein